MNETKTFGPQPGVKRVIVREGCPPRAARSPNGAMRISYECARQGFEEFKDGGKLSVSGAPIDNCLHVLPLT